MYIVLLSLKPSIYINLCFLPYSSAGSRKSQISCGESKWKHFSENKRLCSWICEGLRGTWWILHASVQGGVRHAIGQWWAFKLLHSLTIEWISCIHVIFGSSGLTETMGYWLNLQIFSLTLIVFSIVQVSQKVQEALTERAASFGLVLDDISLVRICLCSTILLCAICVLLEQVEQDTCP